VLFAAVRSDVDDDPVVEVWLDEVHRGRRAAASGDAPGHLPAVGCHVAARGTGDSGREGQVGVQPFVDPGHAGAFTSLSVDDLRLTAGPLRQNAVGVQRVAAEVHQRATGEFERPTWVVCAGSGHEHVRLDPGQLAQLPGCQQLAQTVHDGVVEVMEAVGDDDTRPVSGVAHLDGFHGVGRERLLRQDVLAGPDGGEVPGSVQCVGQRVVDGLDLGIGQQVGVRGGDAFDAVGGGEGRRPLRVTGGDRDQTGAGGVCRLDDGEFGDPGSAEDADTQRPHAVSRPWRAGCARGRRWCARR
jgi:hypothetical protein